MADDAKNPTADKSVDEKGQAKDETNLPPEATKKVKSKKNKKSTKTNAAQATAQLGVAGTEDAKITAESAEIATEDTETSEKNAETNPTEVDTAAETTETNAVEVDTATKVDATAEVSAATKTNTVEADTAISPDFQAEIRDQIENCKFEIVAALQESVHNEMKHVMQNQIRKTERRRVFGVVVRDILILILIVIAGFFAYRLYEYGEFKFLFPVCDQDNQSGSCENQATEPQPEPEPEIIKDLAWYRKNYGNLFDNLQTHLDADKVSAYYLYSGDYKVDDIAPEYLLSMAYNQLSPSANNNILTVPAADLRTAFVDTFGNANTFVKKSFTHDCLSFSYDKANDIFTAPNLTCTQNSSRQILEEITNIYEEGNALYFITVATIYNQGENAYYTFDNLFHPAVTNVTENDLATHNSLLNQYQYQFKRTDDDHFYFSGIIKLK